MTNIIHLNSLVENKNKHPWANDKYYLVYVVDDAGSSFPALFTEHEVGVALSRAIKNPEDSPPKAKISRWKRKVGRILGIC